MKKDNKSEGSILRQRAEELVKRNLSKSGSQHSGADILKLIHELEVHQIELEMQNEELRLAKEREVKLATKKYIELYDFAPSGYFTLSKAGKIIELNLSGANMLGKERSRLKNSLFSSFVSDATKPAFNLFLGKVFSSKVRETCEVSLSINVNVPMYVYLSGIFTENVEHCFVTVLDITERKKAEEALRTSETHLRTLVQTIPDLIWLKDPDGVYLSCNTMFERFFGARGVEIIGKTDYDFVDREIADLFLEHDRKAMEAGKPTSNEEWVTFADDGHHAYLETIKTPMYDSNGILLGVLGIGRDITDRKNAEESLKKQKDEFETIFNLVPAQIWYKDTHNNFIRVNRQVCTDIGMINDKIEGYSAEELFPSFAQQYFKDDLEVINTRMSKLGITEQINTSKGEIRWVHSDKIPVFGNDEEVIGLIAVVQDITELKRSEEALRNSEARLHTL
ncbi:MAG TPA: PAS domain S-box protein, partial [Prolixibacteraceae bacterium]